MTLEQWLLIAIIIISTTLYITQRLRTELVALLTITALGLSGILSPDAALSGFSSSALITVAAMFVLSNGLLKTGALESVVAFLGHYAQGSLRRLLTAVGVTVASASAFVNNTPVVVMMMPVLLSLSRSTGMRASKLLLPLSYFAILGGTVTLLGTSTNILLDDLYRRAGGPGFGLFDFTPLGLIYLILGGAYIVLLGPRLLPDTASLAELTALQPANRYLTEVIVTAHSSLVGRAVPAVLTPTLGAAPRPPIAQTRHRRIVNARDEAGGDGASLALLQLIRAEVPYRGRELETLAFAVGDVLLIAGTVSDLTRFTSRTRTTPGSALRDGERAPINDVRQQMMEAVVLPASPYVGRLIGDLDVYQEYGVSILGLQHEGRQMVTGLRVRRLASGDVLLLQGEPAALQRLGEWGKMLLVGGAEERTIRADKNWIALLIMLGVVVPAAVADLPIAILAISGALLMVLLGCLRLDEALHSLDSPTLFLIAGSIPLGSAMQSTGLAQLSVDSLLRLLDGVPPAVFVSVFYLLTSILTEILSNNAVAVLLTPIAYSLSATLGIDPRPLLVAVAFGASASFMTPIGYQTNAIVMGPGGYTFKDYLRMGAPLNLLLWLTASIFIPVFFPLH
ncbi:MAG: SLC13 family permease [Caldilineaceae bacterium]|nr:SLC13 family permease [Caldilineaceae bacterium]